VAHEKTQAIVLRTLDYSETSQVLALCTESSGQVRVIAKGARRQAMRGVSVPNTLDYCEVIFIPKPPPHLSILTEWQVFDSFPRLRSSLDRVHAALYAVELVQETTDRSEDDAEIFRALLGLERSLAGGEDAFISVVTFELRLLEALGVCPETGQCVQCGSPLGGRAYFSPQVGGALCQECGPRAADALPAMAGTLASVARLRREAATMGMSSGGRLRLLHSVRADMRRLLDFYWDHVLARTPRMRRHLLALVKSQGGAAES